MIKFKGRLRNESGEDCWQRLAALLEQFQGNTERMETDEGKEKKKTSRAKGGRLPWARAYCENTQDMLIS